MTKVSYFASKMPSKGHSSIYKIHKYFARRPHNQFRAVIEHYVPSGGVVLDCFAGGGVTLVEGLTTNRRVISMDVNPVASLIQQGQVLNVQASRINEITTDIAHEVKVDIGDWFETICRHCDASTPYRWIERAYVVECPSCNEETLIDEASKLKLPNGKVKNGSYCCNHCEFKYESVSVIRKKSKILNVRYKCTSCGIEETAEPKKSDLDLNNLIAFDEGEVLAKFNLNIPSDEIPMDWDRQSEDALHRKGFRTFADLFTIRNRTFIAFMLQGIQKRRTGYTDDEYLGALTQISALIRYVNSMTFSTSSWMDGRPVAWAKHAYWTPNQFIEVNPFEYLAHRQLATTKWESDRVSRFSNKQRVLDPMNVIDEKSDYAIICGDSRKIPISDNSVDAVITDPPFGGNVQYGELTHLWQVWLRDANPFETQLFRLQSEILVHRKKKLNGKTAKNYEDGLRDVFKECFRVLKTNGVLSFTFNNKSADAWYAVMKAAFDAGFDLENEGVHYHEEITAYRDTAHLRYDGELQGDVLYTFIKSSKKSTIQSLPAHDDWLAKYIQLVDTSLGFKEQAIELHLAVIRNAATSIGLGRNFKETEGWLNLLSIIGKANKSGESVISTCEGLLSDK
jgi:DNA modification methylase